MREYDPALLGFVLLISDENMQVVKDEIVKAVFEMESDERAYIYRPGSTHIARWPGEAVGQIANYKHSRKFPKRFSEPIDHTVCLMAEEDEDADRHIFIIFDKTVPYMNYEIMRGMKVDRQIDYADEGICNFYLVDLGTEEVLTEAQESNPRCQVVDISPEELGSFILKTYKKEVSFNVAHTKLDLKDIENSYQELKETNGKSKGCTTACGERHEGDSLLTVESGHHNSIPQSVREGDEADGKHLDDYQEQPLSDHFG